MELNYAGSCILVESQTEDSLKMPGTHMKVVLLLAGREGKGGGNGRGLVLSRALVRTYKAECWFEVHSYDCSQGPGMNR